jgi:hypothetical protein
MMQYTSGGAFRQALEARLRKMSREQTISMVRLRKQVAFERFMARLTTRHDRAWVLKGGLAMQLRLGARARTTMDIDLLKVSKAGGTFCALREAAAFDLGDWFIFEVFDPGDPGEDMYAGQRFHVISFLDGRTFEEFAVDVGVDDPLIKPLDCLTFDPVLSFAGIRPTEVSAYNMEQQIAEKLHALTRLYASGTSSRAKDPVDILLLFTSGSIDDKQLVKAVRLTFEARGNPVPEYFPELPPSLAREYGRITRELGPGEVDFDSAHKRVSDFLAPALAKIAAEKQGD